MSNRLALQSNTLRPYLTCIRSTLEAALCIRNFPSQLVSETLRSMSVYPFVAYCLLQKPACFSIAALIILQVERHNKPEVEDKGCKELLLNPLTITRSEREAVFIEPSINSVRVSIKIKQADDMERILVKKFTSFLMKRAEQFIILRRKAVEGYDISFLITHSHAETMIKAKLVDFVISFMEDVDKEISSMRLAVNARSRLIAASFLEGLSGRSL